MLELFFCFLFFLLLVGKIKTEKSVVHFFFFFGFTVTIIFC